MSPLPWLLQADPWYIVLRDITVILAASSMAVCSLFLGLVGWQLWRLGREIKDEAHPIVTSVKEIALTVRDTATFVRDRADALPTRGGQADQTVRTFGQLRRFYRGLNGDR